MTAVALLREQATTMTVQAKVAELAEREIRLGSVYVTLDRMEDKGYVESWLADATPERGGRPKRFYKILPAGERALAEAMSTATRMHQAVENSSWRFGKWRTGRAK